MQLNYAYHIVNCDSNNNLIVPLGIYFDNFVLYITDDGLYQLSLDINIATKLRLNMEQVTRMTYVPEERKIYWTRGGAIRKAYLNGSAEEVFLHGEYIS